MNKKIISVLFTVLFLIFIGIMDYPFIARWINERDQTAVAVDYENTADDLSKEEKEQYLQKAREYNQNLESGANINLELPFSDAETQNSAYMEVLDMHQEGAMAVIEIPKIKLSLPVYHGTSDRSLEKGAGHLEGSSFPIGGESTHAAIAGHRGLPSKKLFTNLDQLEEGDLFFIEGLGEKMAYQIYATEVVTPDVTEPLSIKAGEDLVTLITCTPYGVNTHRIYVHGTRIPYEEGAEQVSALDGFWESYWWFVLTVVLLIWMSILLYWFNKQAKKRISDESNE